MQNCTVDYYVAFTLPVTTITCIAFALLALLSISMYIQKDVLKKFSTISAFVAHPKTCGHRYFIFFAGASALGLVWLISESYLSRKKCNSWTDFYLWFCQIVACLLFAGIGLFYTHGKHHRKTNSDEQLYLMEKNNETELEETTTEVNFWCCFISNARDLEEVTKFDCYMRPLCSGENSIRISTVIHCVCAIGFASLLLASNGYYTITSCFLQQNCGSDPYGNPAFYIWVISLSTAICFVVVQAVIHCTEWECCDCGLKGLVVLSIALEFILLVTLIITSILISIRRNHVYNGGIYI